jgi:hypothetical protein
MRRSSLSPARTTSPSRISRHEPRSCAPSTLSTFIRTWSSTSTSTPTLALPSTVLTQENDGQAEPALVSAEATGSAA